MVDSPDNKLIKGNAYNWDLLVVAAINGLLCIFGLPFMHAVLPHSPLHVKVRTIYKCTIKCMFCRKKINGPEN